MPGEKKISPKETFPLLLKAVVCPLAQATFAYPQMPLQSKVQKCDRWVLDGARESCSLPSSWVQEEKDPSN